MSGTAVVNEIFDRVLDGISPEIRTIVEDGIKAYGKDIVTNPSFTDKVKADRLRKSFDALTRALIERIEALNDYQMLFLCTGALGDEISVGGDAPVKLLSRQVYDGLMNIYKNTSDLPEEMDYVLTAWDRARMIAMDLLYALDPQQAGKRRPKPAGAGGGEGDPKMVREVAIGRKNALVIELETLVPTLEKLFESIQNLDSSQGRQGLETLKIFVDQASGRLASAEGTAKLDLDRNILNSADAMKKYAESGATVLLKIRELSTKYAPQIAELRKTLRELDGLQAVRTDSVRKKFASFDIDKVALIKRDFGYTAGFVAASAESASTRMAFSGSRVLLDSHFNTDDPLNQQICTPERVHKAMQKILLVHPNLFPRSPSGASIVPPIIIDPIRNVVDWLDDRFLMALVSGEGSKKGPNFSLDPVEMQVMRACGMFLSKDSIFNFRGEQNMGTYMGDYSGKVEKSAKVVFAGADKKMTMIASAKQVDSAGRDQAVGDYIEFTFNILNGLGPNPKMSKRRIAVLLRYMVFQDPQTTVNLLLRYAALTELGEVRESLLKLTNTNYAESKRLVENAWVVDAQVPRVLGPKPQQFMQKMFG